jgi:hypothetical protein
MPDIASITKNVRTSYSTLALAGGKAAILNLEKYPRTYHA